MNTHLEPCDEEYNDRCVSNLLAIIGPDEYFDIADFDPVEYHLSALQAATLKKLADHDIHCTITDDFTIIAKDEMEAALIRLTFPNAKVEVRSCS